MSSSDKDSGSPSGEKSPAEKQPTPSRRYEKRQKMMPLELTLGSSSCGDGGSGPYVGIPHNKRCCVCEASGDSPKKRKRTKKAGLSFAPPPSPAVKPEPQECICEVCKTVFTSKEELIMHGVTKLQICTWARGRNFDVGKLIKFHNVVYVKHEQSHQAADEPAALWYGPPTGPVVADPPQLAPNFIPDLNLPPPPQYY